MVKLHIQKAKDRYIARELAFLRASNSTPPMVSHLDEVDQEGNGGEVTSCFHCILRCHCVTTFDFHV